MNMKNMNRFDGHCCSNFSIIIKTLLIMSLLFHPGYTMTDNMRLCGENLVKMMKIVCNDCFNGRGHHDIEKQKKSENFDDAIYGNAVADDCLTSLEETDFSHRGAHRLKRARRGIVEECCIRSCSYAYMRSFCCNNQ
ncbi:Insulin/IGF/Relaxin family protein [Trichinella nativa]|uniref:Insulin/IGF/Relaxin family protein n=2 Tax=Trichinella TaxID=6333 RepID=A0A1Y3ETS5_9BILA|nr:hypothetical protein T05_7794 [Trichinella murrelli]KRX65357.1 hypothetical protein T09_14675 [Trichinella sp. T9]KRX80598.1 hypothetical protein T06_8294 [Trichinella sp. T6]OUC46919.1 Insulin/IGF/Relaxin family protein [Trichinella nativa]